MTPPGCRPSFGVSVSTDTYPLLHSLSERLPSPGSLFISCCSSIYIKLFSLHSTLQKRIFLMFHPQLYSLISLYPSCDTSSTPNGSTSLSPAQSPLLNSRVLSLDAHWISPAWAYRELFFSKVLSCYRRLSCRPSLPWFFSLLISHMKSMTKSDQLCSTNSQRALFFLSSLPRPPFSSLTSVTAEAPYLISLLSLFAVYSFGHSKLGVIHAPVFNPLLYPHCL